MDNLKDDRLEFLDFTGLGDTEREKLRKSVERINSNVQLPWIVTQNVSSSNQSQKEVSEPSEHGAPTSDTKKPTDTTTGVVEPPVSFVNHPFDKGHFQPVYAIDPNMNPFQVHYPATVVHVPAVYSNFHHTSPTNCSVISTVVYNQEPSFIYTQASVTTTYNTYPDYGVVNAPPEPYDSTFATPADENDCNGYGETVVYHSTSEPLETEKTEYKTNGDDSSCRNDVVNGSENTESPPNKSWASLFNKGTTHPAEEGSTSNVIIPSATVKERENGKLHPSKNTKKIMNFVDPASYRLGEFLVSHAIDSKAISLLPRGLINRSNYCYINSILQALLACPPFYNLMSGLSRNITGNKEKRKTTPVIDSVCKLVNEFDHLPANQRVRRNDPKHRKDLLTSINCGNPFEPSWIYKMLNGMRSDSFLVEGRQEDAEEFLGCLLNGLNDEIQELMKLVDEDDDTPCTKNDHETENWQVMGPKNKGSVTRKVAFGKTPISNIFGGLLRSKIHRTGDESTNNIQPFFSLQLNIEKADTVTEALEALTIKNQLEGVTSSKTNEKVEAWQQVLIEELPIVLVLHLKCFDFQLNGCTKITKSLEFPIDLKIDSKLISSKISSVKEKQYKLFAVVYHDGKEATKGHYITDAFHVGYNSWLRYDDASVKPVPEEQVLSPQGCRVPYLLFYRRSDTIRSK